MFPLNRFRHLTLRFVLISLLALVVVMSWGAIASSQIPSLPTAASNDPHKPPSHVTRLGVYEIASVRSPLDKSSLFEVVSPTVFDRDKPPTNSLPVEVRAEEIMQRLKRAFIRVSNAKQTPTISIDTLNNGSILQLNDDRASRPLKLVTVTEPDADYQGKTQAELAQEWQKILQAEVNRIDELFSPTVLMQRTGQAIQISLGLVLASGVLWFLRQQLIRKEKVIQALHKAAIAASEQDAAYSKRVATDPQSIPQTPATEQGETEAEKIAHQRSQFLSRLQQQARLKWQLGIYSFLRWGLFWTFLLLWYIGIAVIMSTVPYLMQWSTDVTAGPLVLLLLWFVISLVIRIGQGLVDRLTHAWLTHPYLSWSESQRITLRATTIAGALKGLISFVFMTLGIVWSLGLFNIPTSSILAGGAVVGIAISLGSQSLIKDLVNGCLILLEDQFAVGDVVQIGNKGGFVEHLNLRVTQLRNSEGQLITIPNSNISDVNNLTRLWSRVDFSIVVAYENDPQKVLDVLGQVSQALYNEPEWHDRIPNPPEVLGIDDLSHMGMLVRVWIQTTPMQQWKVGREFRLRVRQAFEANHIQIGRPQGITYNMDLAHPKPKAIAPHPDVVDEVS